MSEGKDAEHDCKQFNYLGSTPCFSAVCGEGEFTALIECNECNALYFKSIYTDWQTTIEEQLNRNGADRYGGPLNSEQLLGVMREMGHNLEWGRIRELEASLSQGS